MKASRRPKWTAAALIVASVYAGLLAGVSFLATPVKFMAPSLQLPVALDVGRHTFAALNRAEWGFALTLLACCFGARSGWGVLGAAALLAALTADMVWLLPALDGRVGAIMRGQWPEPSALHHVYIGLDVAKLAILIAVAAGAARRLNVPAPSPDHPAHDRT